MTRRSRGQSPTGDLVSTKIVVWDSVPTFREGLSHRLESHGYVVEEDTQTPSDSSTIQVRQIAAIVIGGRGRSFNSAVTHYASTIYPVVTVADDVDPAAVHNLLARGSVGLLPRDARPSRVIRTVEAVMDGDLVMDPSFTFLPPLSRPTPRLAPHEVAWLRNLGAGRTVAEIAEAEAFSQRHFQRLLKRLYERMGADGRIQALTIAAQAGLLG